MERPPLQLDPEQQVLLDRLHRSAGEGIYAHELATGRVFKGVSHGMAKERVWIKDEEGVLEGYPLIGWQYIVDGEQSNGYETI